MKSKFSHNYPFQRGIVDVLARFCLKLRFAPELFDNGYVEIVSAVCPRCKEKIEKLNFVQERECKSCGLKIYLYYKEGELAFETMESNDREMEKREMAKIEEQFKRLLKEAHVKAIVEVLGEKTEIVRN